MNDIIILICLMVIGWCIGRIIIEIFWDNFNHLL